MASGLEWLLHLAGLCLKEGALRAENALQSNLGVKTGGLPKKERVTSSSLFEEIYRRGRYLKGKNFVINYFLPYEQEAKISSKGNASIKVAFVVSKKVSKLAVCRNRLKRQMREAYRFNRSILPATTNLALILRALPVALNASYNEIEDEIKGLFKLLAAKEFGDSLN